MLAAEAFGYGDLPVALAVMAPALVAMPVLLSGTVGGKEIELAAEIQPQPEVTLVSPPFGPVTGGHNAAAGVRAYTQTGQTTSPEFEFFDDYDGFLYNVLSGRARHARYLGRGTNATVSEAALDDAIAALRKSQGPDPARWRAAMPQIRFQSLDVADLPPVPWENRGTWGEAIAMPAAH